MRIKIANVAAGLFAGVISAWMLGSPAVGADVAPGQNAVVVAPPTTAPTAYHSVPRVEVFPFAALNPQNAGEWTGRGIAESLQSDVSHTGSTLILPQAIAAGGENPINVARQNHADLAVVGSYQIAGDQVRADGHVVDVATNTTLGSFAATGDQKDLFKVEDALGEQLRALLPHQLTTEEASHVFDQAPAVQPIYTEAPAYSSQPTVNNYYSDSAAPYYYSDYGYNYYPFGLGIYGGFDYYGGGRSYGYHRGFDRGFGGSETHGHLSVNPSFHNPVYSGRARGGFGGAGLGGGFHGGRGGGGGRR